MKELIIKIEDDTPAKQYQCTECGLHYEDGETAKQCQAWCSKNKSCNLEIINKSIEGRSKPKQV